MKPARRAPQKPARIPRVGFVSLGLPDGLLGVAWPSIRARFDLQLAYFDPAGYTRYVTEQTARERASLGG